MHDDLFGLFEAMSAIEMMDPKMDAGMLCNRGIRRITSFDQAVQVINEGNMRSVFKCLYLFQDKILKLNDFEDKEIVGIIDSTFACLVSWLEGHSLAQTVFINLYLHKPFLIEDKIVKGFCLAIYKLLEIIKDVVHKYDCLYNKLLISITFILVLWYTKKKTFNPCSTDTT